MKLFKNLLLKKENLIYLIPFIALLAYSAKLHLAGPFFLSRIDPEYPYLLNGLNFAILDTNRIGHTDHPGTPFQLLTGIFIRLIHLLSGDKQIINDVISDPEHYLFFSSFLLSLITIIVVVWIGRIVYKHTKDVVGTFIIQSSIFLSTILLSSVARYFPDRLQVILVLAMVGFTLKLLFDESYSERKYAIHVGIMMGLGFITKFNFLPLLFIPLITLSSLRYRLWYIGSIVVTSFLSLIPILNKLAAYRNFIMQVATHDSLYGQGNNKVLNPEALFGNIVEILTRNGSFTIILAISVILFIFLLFTKKGSEHGIEKRILAGIFIAVSISILIIAKHYKNYYVLPLVSLGGFMLFICYSILRKQFNTPFFPWVAISLLLALTFQPLIKHINSLSSKSGTLTQDELIVDFARENIAPQDFLLVNPSWRSGGMVENGLIYGFSYVAHRQFYYDALQRYHKNLIVWEAQSNSLSYARMIHANPESILKSGKDIFLYTTSERNSSPLIDFIKSEAQRYNIKFSIDTLFNNSERSEYFLRFKQDTWQTAKDIRCGFEKTKNGKLLSNDENSILHGSFKRSQNVKIDGNYGLLIDSTNNATPSFAIANVREGDYIELSIKCHSSSNKEQEKLALSTNGTGVLTNEKIPQLQAYSSHEIKPKWKLRRISFEITGDMAGNIELQFIYSGNREIVLDDFHLLHFSANEH